MALDIKLDPGVFLLGALGLLILPLNWFVGAVAAAVFHEVFHLFAVYALGGRVTTVTVGVRGAEMEIGPISPEKELICALAGPAGSFLMVIFRRWAPVLSVCGMLQGLFNLLPLYPLDGGRALFCYLTLLLNEDKALHMIKAIQWIFGFCVTFFAVLAVFIWKLGAVPVFGGFIIYFTGVCRKNSLQTGRRESTIRIPFIMR